MLWLCATTQSISQCAFFIQIKFRSNFFFIILILRQNYIPSRNMLKLLILLMPILVAADIKIDVIAAEDESERQVHITGSDVSIITDEDLTTFNLDDDKLKAAVKAYYGKKPDDLFLKSPTPWGDLYKTYNWQQVSRILKPIRANMSSIQYKPVAVFTQHFNNTSKNAATYKAYVCQKVEDTIASMWESNGVIASNLNISYGFNVMAMGVSGKSSISYISKWGENVMKSESVTVGSETGLEITLQPGQGAKATLYATRGEMKVTIDYEVSLTGFLAVNYADIYKGHYFHGLDVNSVLRAAGINLTVISSEIIALGYYSDSEVMVQDVDTNDVFYS